MRAIDASEMELQLSQAASACAGNTGKSLIETTTLRGHLKAGRRLLFELTLIDGIERPFESVLAAGRWEAA